MIQYNQLSESDKSLVEQKAVDFTNKHQVHVKNLMKETVGSVAPSGSDIFKPELWKGIHWNWFYQEQNPVQVEEKKKSLIQRLKDWVF